MSWLVHLYPPSFRCRYGPELAAILEQERPSVRLVADVLAGAFDAWVAPQRAGRGSRSRRLPTSLLLLVVLAARTVGQGLVYLAPQPALIDATIGTLVLVLLRRRLRLGLAAALGLGLALELAILGAHRLLPGYTGLAGVVLWSAFVCYRLRGRRRGWPRWDDEGGEGAGVPAQPLPDPTPMAATR